MFLPIVTAARSDSGVSRFPAGRTRRLATSIATIASVGVPVVGPRPPIAKTMPPSVAAAPCVVGAGRCPMRRTRPVEGTYSSTASVALPFSSEPPAMTIELLVAATAA